MEQTEWIDLVERSRRGDPEARDALVRAAQNRIYYHCKKMLKHEEDAQDAADEHFSGTA